MLKNIAKKTLTAKNALAEPNAGLGLAEETKMKYTIVFVTVPNKKEAKKIADIILKEKLVACVNIINKLESIYWWQGKIEKSNELLLIMKTKTSLSKELIKKIKSIHTYEVPEIIFLPITAGNTDYLKWIDDSLL